MIINFSQGRIIVTAHELVVRLNHNAITLQSTIDGLQLLLPSCVMLANGAECKWSLKLDNQQQIQQISQAAGVEVIEL